MNWDPFVFPLTYGYNVQIYQTKKLLSFSLATTLLPPGPIDITRPISPEVREVDSPLAYRLRFIHRAALLKHMTEKNSKNAQV